MITDDEAYSIIESNCIRNETKNSSFVVMDWLG